MDDLYFLKFFSNYENNEPEYLDIYYESCDSVDLKKIREYFGFNIKLPNEDELKTLITLKKWAVKNLIFEGSELGDQRYDKLNCFEILKSARMEGFALNCRYISLIFTQILLSIGFKARLVSCMSIRWFTIDCEIINIKIYDKTDDIDQSKFETILEYIYEEYNFNIINISMGIVVCGNTGKMQKICNNFHKKGTIIVSAFDNNGAVSYPAALDNVVGVDGQINLYNQFTYTFVKNSIVNVIGVLKFQKVAWIKPDYILVKGNSFICAEVTAKIAQTNGCCISDRLKEFCDIKKLRRERDIT